MEDGRYEFTCSICGRVERVDYITRRDRRTKELVSGEVPNCGMVSQLEDGGELACSGIMVPAGSFISI